MKTSLFLLFLTPILAFSQLPDSLNYFPVHVGDVWQYRSAFTNEIKFNRYVDSMKIDSNKNTYVWTRSGNEQLNFGGFKIDSASNVYNLYFQPDYIRYKLNADSGNSWIGGITGQDTTIITMIFNSYGYIYGKYVPIKVYEFVLHRATGTTIWIGRDYLAQGFGLVQMDVEPSDVYQLSGAILNGIKYGTIVSVKENIAMPELFELIKNYPNPFNSSTKIFYSIAQQSSINLTIYDALGRKVETLVDGKLEKGNREISFNGSNLTSGVYFAVLQTGLKTLTHKLLLLK